MEYSNIKIHISAPMSLDIEHLYKVRQTLNTKYCISTNNITFWNRYSKYNYNDLTKADVVIVLNPDMKFNTKNQRVAPGVSKELCYAIDNNICIYMAYQKSDGNIEIYDCEIEGDTDVTSITGISRTSGPKSDFSRLCDNYRTKPSIEVEDGLKTLGIDSQDELNKTVHKMMQNSTYGSFGELDHPDNPDYYNPDYDEIMKKWKDAGFLGNIDPIVELPKVQRVYAKTIPNPDYQDERLLFLL